MRNKIICGAVALAISALVGCRSQEPARSPSGDLEGVADKTTDGLDKNGSTINASGESVGDKAGEMREQPPPPAEKPQPPQPPPPEPKP